MYLINKTNIALESFNIKQLVVVGGVAANSRFRYLMQENIKKYPNVELIIPPLAYCTDNAAMIGARAAIEYKYHNYCSYDLTAKSTIDIDTDDISV